MNPDAPLYCFDTSRQALIFALPGSEGQMMGIPVRNLRDAGWDVTEAGLRASLPRFGQPSLHQATDMAAARELARTLDVGRRRRDK